MENDDELRVERVERVELNGALSTSWQRLSELWPD